MTALTQKLFVLSVFFIALGASKGEAAVKCPKDKLCYCAAAEGTKNLLGKSNHAFASSCMLYANQTPDSLHMVYPSKDDKNLGKCSDSKLSSKAAELNCMTECLGKDRDTATKIVEGKAGFAETNLAYGKAVKGAVKTETSPTSILRTSAKQCGSCPKDKNCFCSDPQEKNGTWKSNCGYLAPGFNPVGEPYKAASKKQAVEDCARGCFCAQSVTLMQQANGTWIAK